MDHPPQPATILELRGIGKQYRSKGRARQGGGQTVVALNNVTLDFRAGEIFGLVGESGSGKTTCGRLIVGLEKADQGELLLEGRSYGTLKGESLREYRRQVQIIFQDPYQSLNPQLSILDSVAEPLVTNRVGDNKERLEKVLTTLKAVGLSPPEDYAFRFPHQLSGGQRQRVAIARAMILGPKVLVADEPTSMLDASYSAQIFDILLEVRQRLATTIILITHSLAAARYLCDRIAVIYRGNLMETGPADAVISDPRHPYTQALIDATPKFGDCGPIKRYGTLVSPERPASGSAGCAFFRRCGLAHLGRCARQAPELTPLTLGHLVACHYASQTPVPETGQACRLGGM
ncbi:MAG: ABC transporter ATP-binding protein [Desulfarculus sp.]|nr:ABC transporter ATP-binding protein [Desulfarculus sp.]